MLPGVFALLSDDAPVFGLVVIGGHAVVGIHPVGRRLTVGREAPEGEGRIVQLSGVSGGLCHLPDDTANHDERRAILQQFIKEIRVRKDYEISITLNASFNQVEQLKAVSTYDGAEIFEEISEKGA